MINKFTVHSGGSSLRNTDKVLTILGLTLIAGALMACAQGADGVPVASEADEAADEETTSEEGAGLAPLTDVQVAELPRPDEACIACHTNEELLQGLATEEEAEGEALSSGEG
jgi:hypothetical protein